MYCKGETYLLYQDTSKQKSREYSKQNMRGHIVILLNANCNN